MSGILGQLVRNASIYGFANLLSRFIGFLMIPVYTRLLTPADYGAIELLDLTGAILAMWMGFSISNAIVRFYYEYDGERDRGEVVSTALLFVGGVSLAATLALLPFSGAIARALLGPDARGALVAMMLGGLFFQLLSDNCLVYLQLRQEAARYAAFSLARLFLGLSLNILFVVVLRRGIEGILLSGLAASAAVGGFLAWRTFAATGVRFSPTKLRPMLAFGFPMIFSNLGAFVITFSDRYFLNAYSTLSEVGVYSLGYKLAMLVAYLITNPFLTTWSAKRFEIAKRPDAPQVCAQVCTWFGAAVVFAALGLTLFAGDIVRVIADPAFAAAAAVVPVVALGYVFNGLYYHFGFGIFMARRTRAIAAIMASAAGVNLLLNWALIPGLDGMGAALATALSFLYVAAGTYVVSQRMVRVPYELGRLGAMLLLAGALYGISRLARFDSVPLSLAWAALLLALFPGVLLAAGFLKPEEAAAVREGLAALRRRGVPVPACARAEEAAAGNVGDAGQGDRGVEGNRAKIVS